MAKFSLSNLIKPVQRRIGELTAERDGIDAELEKLNRVIADLGGKSSRNGQTVRRKSKKSGKRVRSSPDELREKASAIVKFVKAAGKEGASAGDIIKRYPVTGSVKAFLKKWAPDGGVTPKGKRKLTRYFAD